MTAEPTLADYQAAIRVGREHGHDVTEYERVADRMEAEQSENAYLDGLLDRMFPWARKRDDEDARTRMRAVLAKLEADGWTRPTPSQIQTSPSILDDDNMRAYAPFHRVPRLWEAGDPEPEIGTQVISSDGFMFMRDGTGNWFWEFAEPSREWRGLAFPVTEVLPEKETNR